MILYDAAQSHPVIVVFFLFFGADTDTGIDREAATAMLVNQQTYLLQFWFFLLVLEASPAACADETAPDCNDSDGSKMKTIFFLFFLHLRCFSRATERSDFMFFTKLKAIQLRVGLCIWAGLDENNFYWTVKTDK